MRFVSPSRVNGTITAPPSKSVTQRAIFAAWLAKGESCISKASISDDGQAALGAISALGARVFKEEGILRIIGGLSPGEKKIDCGESGLCLRMLCALSSLAGEEHVITGRGSLLSRPLGLIEEPLAVLGVACRTSNGCAPVGLKGHLRGGTVEVDGSQSSQFISGLLMALPVCREESEVHVKNLTSRPYINLTLQVMRDFGIQIDASESLSCFRIKGGQEYKAGRYEIEGDWSGASCMLVAGAIAGEVGIEGLKESSLQADRALLDVLEKSGARVWTKGDTIKVCSGELNSFEFDATDCPDLFPALVALSCYCKGKTRLRGCQRLLSKESNRLETLISEFGKLGACLACRGNSLEIEGTELEGGAVYSHQDHRIAMACAVAGLRSRQGVFIEGDEAVSKSYPEFFDDLKSIMEQK